MKFLRHSLKHEVEQAHPRARLALDELDSWAREQGWNELLVVEVLAERDGWARTGCSWAVRLRVYSRVQRQALRKRLAAGRQRPEWDIIEAGDVLRCVLRDFPWRAERLGQ